MEIWTRLPLPKGKTIGVHSCLLARSARDIIEASSAEVFSCLIFEFIGVSGYGGELVFQ